MRHHEEILKASPPRVFEELQKLFAYGAGEKACRLLYKTGLLHDLLARNRGFSRPRSWPGLRALDLAGTSGQPHQDRGQGRAGAGLCRPLFRPGARIAARYAAQGERVVYNALLEDLLHPICVRMSMPKWMCSRMIQIMANQTRFEPDKKKRFSKRGFVAHECFPETLALYQLGLLVAGADLGRRKSGAACAARWRRKAPWPCARSQRGGPAALASARRADDADDLPRHPADLSRPARACI
jgi:poly(A) polymerase